MEMEVGVGRIGEGENNQNISYENVFLKNQKVFAWPAGKGTCHQA